jgi:hypothetical protein
VLNAIYEEDFLGFSYGFRPKRNPHDALDALTFGICSTEARRHVGARPRGSWAGRHEGEHGATRATWT